MEDALAQLTMTNFLNFKAGLNPCFNGRCTRTYNLFAMKICNKSLNPCFNGRCTRTNKKKKKFC